MEDKALLQILVYMLAYYKHQARMLVWVVVIVLAMHLATVIGFLYYESQFETISTTTTQTVDGKDSGHQKMIQHLERMYDEAEDEKERQMISEWMRKAKM